jgi:hypothetical protein
MSCQRQLITSAIIDKVVGAVLLTESFEAISLSNEALFVGTVFIVFDVPCGVDPVT